MKRDSERPHQSCLFGLWLWSERCSKCAREMGSLPEDVYNLRVEAFWLLKLTDRILTKGQLMKQALIKSSLKEWQSLGLGVPRCISPAYLSF